MATDPYAAPGSEDLPKLFSSAPVPDASYVAQVSPEVFPGLKAGAAGAGGGGGIGNSGGPSQRQRDEAKKHKEDAAWEAEREAAMQEMHRANQEPAELIAPKPSLSNARFLCKNPAIRDKVTVLCDFGGSAKATGITFVLQVKNNQEKNEKGAWLDLDTASGKPQTQGASAEMTLLSSQSAPDYQGGTFRVLAKHADAIPAESPPLDVGPEILFTGMLYYSPKRKGYLLCQSKDEALPWLTEMQRLEDLSGKSRQAWAQTDPARHRAKNEEVAKEAKELFTSHIDAKDAVEELLQVRSNKFWGKAATWGYLRSDMVDKADKANWVRDKDPEVVKILEKVRRQAIRETNAKLDKKASGADKTTDTTPDNAPDQEPLWRGGLKAKLFEKEIEPATPWHWAAYESPKPGKDSGQNPGQNPGQNNSRFTFSKETAFMRLLAGWNGVELEASPLQGKLSIGLSGHASFGIFEGKFSASYDWPDKKGYNLLEALGDVKYKDDFIKQGHCVNMRLRLSSEANYFEGASIIGALTFPCIDFSKEKETGKRKHDATAKVEMGGFVGGRVGGELGIEAQWSMSPALDFATLGMVGGGGGVSSGIGGGGKLEIGYKDGRFIFHISAEFAKGLGLKGGLKWEVDVEQGTEFIGHLFRSVNYHRVWELTGDAFEAYKNFQFAVLAEGFANVRADVQAGMDKVKDFAKWLEKSKDNIQYFKTHIAAYTGMTATMGRTSPEALGQALFVMMQTREDRDFTPILWILKNAGSEHKLRWIVRGISRIVMPKPRNKVEKAAMEAEIERLKQLALEDGKQRLLDFGKGIGYPKSQKNELFLTDLSAIFSKNRI